jgi:hypothetical protein
MCASKLATTSDTAQQEFEIKRQYQRTAVPLIADGRCCANLIGCVLLVRLSNPIVSS